MNAIDMTKLDLEACKAQAAAYHKQGFNCAQAVACSLAPALGFDTDTAFRILEGFGAGMGGMTETCGALSGAVAILGLLNSEGMENPTTKRHSYKLSREAAARFKDKNTTTICRELKGVGSDAGPIRSCPGCIDDAVEIAIQIIKEQQA
ncbi:C-GCAxxG-C-C family protein [Collinsella bouchesdurhonensis]|uniref:C-GCAxxG-C-C family protein n=1 Tax=Collinsella bouchesdurhonensis TaxID=1907654 RepID=UPI0034A2607A